jgi:hypothetical protein
MGLTSEDVKLATRVYGKLQQGPRVHVTKSLDQSKAGAFYCLRLRQSGGVNTSEKQLSPERRHNDLFWLGW